MHKVNNLLLIIFFLPYKFNSYAQDKVDAENYNIEIPNVPSQGNQHHAKITLINGQKLKGVITSIGGNGIQLEKVVYKKSKGGRPETQKPLSFNEVNYSDIQTIKIRSTFGERIVGFFVGTGIGVFAGGLGGLAISCEDCNLEDRLGLIILFGGLGGAIGGPLGAIQGAFKVHIEIAGQYSNYEKFKNEMEAKRLRRMKRHRSK